MLKLRFTRGAVLPPRLRLTPEQYEDLRAWGDRHPELWRHRPPEPPDYSARRAAAYQPPAKFSPRERPSLAHPLPGAEAITEEEIKAWVEQEPFVRGGLSQATQRAMAFIATFAPPGGRS